MILEMDGAYVLEQFFRLLKKLRLLNIFFLSYFFINYYLKYRVKNALEVKGRYNININKPAIIIGNHSSYHDFFVTMGTASRFGRIIHGLVTEQDWKHPLVRIAFKYIEMVPRMGNGDEIIERMVNTLNKNKILVLSPEGTISKGLVMQAFTGFIRVYFKANQNGYKIPIIPCFIQGIAQAYPEKKNYFTKIGAPKKVKITIKIGKPFHLKIPDNIDRNILRKYADYVMLEKVAKLGGQKKLRPNFKLENWHNQGLNKRNYEIVDEVEL